MKRNIALLIAVLVVCSLSVTAIAHEMPDLTQNGTITFTLDWNGEPLDSGSLTLCKVADIVVDDGDVSFVLIDALQGYDIDLEDLDDADLAAELARIGQEEALPDISAPIEDGRAVFSDIAPGLYVVWQDEASDGFAAISPFLISMPKYENGHYEIDVTAAPKVPLVTLPTQPTEPEPTTPSDPQLPQTGQLNWPIPVLTVSGLALFAAGWFLCFRRKTEKNEK